MIKIIDNFLKVEYYEKMINFCERSTYLYGEKDSKDSPETGMVHNFNLNSSIVEVFQKNLIDLYPEIKKFYLERMYINCFAPSENPYFHIDAELGITCLYYPTKSWNYDDGGETQFILNDEIKGVLPIPNRIVIFDSNILHKATSFRNKHRFTVALKYKPNSIFKYTQL